MLFPPESWTNPVVRLYHGTLVSRAASIVADGIQVSAGRTQTDFGPGFYTTTLERQAQSWAYQAAQRISGETAAVIMIEADRDELANLHTLAFVRGDFDAEDYWSFVVHCRSGARDHRCAGHSGGLYDLVIGPVASFWQQRTTIAGSDQISFHTLAAETVLNSSPRLLTWISNP